MQMKFLTLVWRLPIKQPALINEEGPDASTLSQDGSTRAPVVSGNPWCGG